MMTVQPISIRKQQAEQRLAETRRDRGSAVLEGRIVDHAEIAQLEAEVAALAEAEAEQWRRQQASIPRLRAQRYQDELAAYIAANDRRLEAVDRMERSARKMAAGLADAQAEAETMRRAFQAMSNLRQPGNHDEGDMTPLRQATRLADYVRVVLFGVLKVWNFGHISIAPKGGDPAAETSWREMEAKRGSALEFLRTNAPRVPDDDERGEAA